MSQRDAIISGDIDLFGAGAAFHHIGLVVTKIDVAHAGLQKFVDPAQDVTVAFVSSHGTTIELIQPLSDKSPVAKSLAKGVKLVHICYSVPNLDQAIAHAARKNVRLIAKPVPAVAFDGRRIAWLYHATLGLFELLEDQKT